MVAQSPVSGTVTPLVVLYDTFFARLFMYEPSMRLMFEDNMIRQSKFLVGLVNIMVREREGGEGDGGREGRTRGGGVREGARVGRGREGGRRGEGRGRGRKGEDRVGREGEMERGREGGREGGIRRESLGGGGGKEGTSNKYTSDNSKQNCHTIACFSCKLYGRCVVTPTLGVAVATIVFFRRPSHPADPLALSLAPLRLWLTPFSLATLGGMDDALAGSG